MVTPVFNTNLMAQCVTAISAVIAIAAIGRNNMVHARNKGHNGEREFCKILNTLFEQETISLKAERNVDQVRDGGADVMTVPPFAIEIKRGERVTINPWRKQAIRQVTDKCPVPVLAYRQNNKPWKIQMLVNSVCRKRVRADGEWMEISLEYFLQLVVKAVNGRW